MKFLTYKESNQLQKLLISNAVLQTVDEATSQKPLRGKMKATTASLASQPIACGC
ncbi:MAG: hypothetical protein O9290_09395 [Microcystis sp. LE19-41.2A]|uniref:hypothetical protein n=1 Tax=Microcystis sp. LE19-41.2A TaxID=3016427 RepID=UPI0022BC87DE|nr:hypothetical protein [Microcystis sp. LE19-41.2A]MCZ8046842.1 hypothetical protein [Microcystis sp. LE19-41.2A]